MLRVRIASPDELRRIAAFYRETTYRPLVGPADLLVVAEDAEEICGALRICQEEGVLVLRGMRVALRRQRQGVGTRLLEAAEEAIGGRECLCIPHRHLTAFYGRAGFCEIPATAAPRFLRERWKQYTEEYRLDVVVMRRPPVSSGVTRIRAAS
jgi:GNAT superfamily N-acetyltransferase